MKFSEFVYKRTDVDEVRNRIREITEELKHASSLEEQIQAVYKMNEVEKEISTADSLVYIRYTINTKNEFYAKEREYNDRISPMLEEEFQKYNEVLLQSRFRRELEEKFGKVLFLNLCRVRTRKSEERPMRRPANFSMTIREILTRSSISLSKTGPSRHTALV